MELRQETRQAVVQHFIRTKQYLVDALIENLEKALARVPVKTGPAEKPVGMYVFRGEVANNAIKLAGA